MKSAVVYLVLALVLGRYPLTRALRTYLLASAVGVSMLVGASRIYLGVHWPSDVIAGWAFGVVWAVACFFVANRLRRAQIDEGTWRSS